jgi:selenocysteine lyase/cysteine desulfurase
LNNNEEREEGGTPAIIESIRLGLVFKLKDSLNHGVVTAQEHKFAR